MKSIAFIDNFIKVPVNHCVNEFILRNKLPCTYHQPARFGMRSLYELPKPDGIVILGSASHVEEKLLWHTELIHYVLPLLEQNTPTLGICFGHQLMAEHFGAKVGYIDVDQTNYTQLRDVHFQLPFGSLSKTTKMQLPYAHQQVVKSIGQDYEVMATSLGLGFEGLKHKTFPLWSFQSHPESSLDFIQKDLNILDKDHALKIKQDGNILLDEFAKIVLNH